MSGASLKYHEVEEIPLPVCSVEEYLAAEAVSAEKHEYAGGPVIAMAGATETHETIAGNLHGLLWLSLKGKPCRVFKSDLKLRVRHLGNTYFYYPDLMIACDPDDRESPLFKDRPLVLIEVISPSSKDRDTETKVFVYMSIPSLRSYLIVSHEHRHIIHYRRTDEGWAMSLHPETGDRIHLPELGLELTVDNIYERVGIA
jgi:Uma2 family endonuclease